MGYFANLYVVEADATKAGVKATTTIYGSEIGPEAYFCWGPGKRTPGRFHQYAGGTVQCDVELSMLTGYPHDNELRIDDDCALVEANFRPKHDDDPVLFHFVLPRRFLPRRDMEPLEQPCQPFVYSLDGRIIATYPVTGPAVVRFWITRLRENEAIGNKELVKLFHPQQKKSGKWGVEFNWGVFKYKYER